VDYLRAVGKLALGAGLKHTIGRPVSVETRDGRIVSLRLRDGKRVTGDLFIDASGPEACLIRRLEAPDNFESWSRWLPCDRLLVAEGPVLNPIPAFSQVSAFKGGWLGLFPLMDRTAMMVSYGSRHAKAEDVLETLVTVSGLRTKSDAAVDTIEPGGRRKPWLGNCVAIGNTAFELDPLDAAQLHLVHTAITFLVSLFPVDSAAMPEADVYNAKMRSYAAGVRDFQAAHYKLNRRFGEKLWDAVREQEAPPGLARKLKLFEARGVVSMGEHETFQEENWTSIFIGHRLMPRTWDPQVDRVPEQEQIANFQRMLKFIATEVQSMPSLQAHLELNAPQSTSDYIF
jgi:tryptophan halogenase